MAERLLLLAGLAAVSCGAPFGTGQAVRPAVTATPIAAAVPAAAGYLFGLAWLRDGSLVATSSPDTSPGTAQVWRFPSERSVQRLPAPFDRSCRNDELTFPSALPDGRVAFTRTCNALDDPSVFTATVVAFDPASGGLATLSRLGRAMSPLATSWNPSLTRGVGAQTSDVCAEVAWLTTDGPAGIQAEIAGGGRSWRLDAWLTQPGRPGCTNDGRAASPSWSPDGRTVALLASPESAGVGGQARLDVPWSVYLLDVASLRTRRLLGGLGGAAGLTWSPDGRWLALTADIRGRGTGLWLFSPATGALRLVGATRSLGVPAWSPEGRRIAAIENLSPGWPPRTRVAIADVGKIVSQ